MRGSVALDLVLTRNVGLTAGYEFGGKSPEARFGAASGFSAQPCRTRSADRLDPAPLILSETTE